ncbi:hypothetical protein [Microbacterium sp. SLBN-146]|uniref:hypothetical protein n=1 Tax=Microbacterium sp. SLBN-146 TaxID=2768457 RepID=UPI00114F3A2A|nr:hypothetical protein [Microbacterium sp. SLBN-146]TQJ29614.1 hypothetical protein FBY39_0057 [Microbacterium sp. SLBN-146]
MPTSSFTRSSARASFAARAALTAGVCAAIIAGPVSAASASTAPGESNDSNTMVIRVEIPARTAAPTPAPTDDPAAGGNNGALPATGFDASLLFLLAGAGVVAIGAGTAITARRRAQAARTTPHS